MSRVSPAEASLPWTERVRRDPFRVFFPLGVLAGVLGVGHWAIWTSGWPVGMIGYLHPMLQSQGFLGFFVVGFLMTALPRFTGADYARPWEVALAAAGGLAFLAAALSERWVLAQAAFLTMLLTVPACAAARFKSATKPIPPSFVLIGFGMLHAVVGTLLMAATRMGQTDFALFRSGRQMVQTGFLLCIVLGVTAKLAPFLLGHAEDPRAPPGPGAVRLAEVLPHGFTGALLLATFLAEPAAPSWMRAIRAAAATLHLVRFAGIARLPKKKSVTILLFWTACWMTPLGLWLAALFPARAVAFMHVTFIGGFSLMIFSFGLLVVLSHSGRAVLLNGPLWPLRIAGPLILGALALRVAADLVPAREIALLHSASGLWVLAAVIWGIYAVRNMSAAPLAAEPVRMPGPR